MASRRELIDAEDFHRQRAVAALTRGDTLDTEEVPRRPNSMLLIGVVVALLVCAVSAVTAFLGGRAPDDWNADGALVVDKQTGASYVAQGGELRPTPTLTASLLAGARAQPVLVPHELVARAPIGLPLPGNGTPGTPPVVTAPVDFIACITAPATVDVFADQVAAQAAGADGILVRAVGTQQLALVAGRRLYKVDQLSLIALGYSATQVRDVPAYWFDLFPRGTDLVLQRPVPSPTGSVPGVGAGGTTVASAESGRKFLISGGLVRPLANLTTELLLPPPTAVVADAALLAAPTGPPAGLVDVPTTPPRVPDRQQVVEPCVRASDGLLVVASTVADGPGTRPSPTREVGDGPTRLRLTWHFPPGGGALVGPPDVNAPRPTGDTRPKDDGVQVVAAGVGYPVVGDDVLRTLGYDRADTTPLPRSWLALLTPGVPLVGRT